MKKSKQRYVILVELYGKTQALIRESERDLQPPYYVVYEEESK